jgi:hypothetical protein
LLSIHLSFWLSFYPSIYLSFFFLTLSRPFSLLRSL